jgi:hypothetical protein
MLFLILAIPNCLDIIELQQLYISAHNKLQTRKGHEDNAQRIWKSTTGIIQFNILPTTVNIKFQEYTQEQIWESNTGHTETHNNKQEIHQINITRQELLSLHERKTSSQEPKQFGKQ